MTARAARLATGLVAASAIALSAYQAGLLKKDGAVAGAILGAAVFAGTGIAGSAAFVTYFVTSSLLGKLPINEECSQRRGISRDAFQVVANGGIPAMLALATLVNPGPNSSHFRAAFAGAVATAAADTWATELGTRFGRNPRSIVGLASVARGSSGGITLAGIIASAAGAALIASLLAPSVSPEPKSRGRVAVAIALSGFTGALADSGFGATLQEVRICDFCRLETEAILHACGTRTRRVRGQPWCNNDVVNMMSVTLGALSATAIAKVFTRGGAFSRLQTEPAPAFRRVRNTYRRRFGTAGGLEGRVVSPCDA